MKNSTFTCYVDISDPNYNRHLFDFEKNFDIWGHYWWFYYNWTKCFYFIAIYLIVIFAGRQYMKSRPPFQLRKALFLWNVFLAVFSIMASCRFIPEILYNVQEYGFRSTVCEIGSVQHKQALAIWGYLFAVSKIVELGDTAFIILRKTPLIFLHWYHHVSVLFLVWSSSGWPSAIHTYFALVNYFVHSVMYSYYALRAIRVKIPKKVSMAVTMLQLVQMVIGLAIISYAKWQKSMIETCCLFDEAVWLALGVYASYLLLFGNFFIKTYFPKKASQEGTIKKTH